MKRLILFFFAGVLLFILLAVFVYFAKTEETGITVTAVPSTSRLTMLPHQCIDTMKVSRDRARELENDPKAEQLIAVQVQQIASLGATCVAIGTPYDDEFVPYMEKWVAAARKNGLSVWFRGNWSGWEGWFSYPKKLSPEEHIQKTETFIRTHPDLFADGDIFSPIVEPENGGPFNPVNTEAKTNGLRAFISTEQETAINAFASIDKKVTTNWISMSGGVAKYVINKPTAESLQNIVTLDHYVSNKEGMSEYIMLFADSLNAKVVLGEFGAPIPDLNGQMDDTQQNDFVETLLWELFLHRSMLAGMNYWTYSESSTALVNEHGERKPVAETLKRYYIPGKLNVQAVSEHGRSLKNVIITLKDDDVVERTDSKGKATILLPQGTYTLKLITTTGKTLITPLTVAGNQDITVRGVFSGN